MESSNPFDKLAGDFCVIPSEYFKKLLDNPLTIPKRRSSINLSETFNYVFIGLFISLILLASFAYVADSMCCNEIKPKPTPPRIINLYDEIEKIVNERVNERMKDFIKDVEKESNSSGEPEEEPDLEETEE